MGGGGLVKGSVQHRVVAGQVRVAPRLGHDDGDGRAARGRAAAHRGLGGRVLAGGHVDERDGHVKVDGGAVGRDGFLEQGHVPVVAELLVLAGTGEVLEGGHAARVVVHDVLGGVVGRTVLAANTSISSKVRISTVTSLVVVVVRVVMVRVRVLLLLLAKELEVAARFDLVARLRRV